MSDFKVLASSSTFISPTAQGLNAYLNARVSEAAEKVRKGSVPSESWVPLFNQYVAQLPESAFSSRTFDIEWRRSCSPYLEALPLQTLAKMDLKELGRKLPRSVPDIALAILQSADSANWRWRERQLSLIPRRMANFDVDESFIKNVLESVRSSTPPAPSICYRLYTTYKDQPAYVEDCKRLSADVKGYFVAIPLEECKAIESYSALLRATYLSASPTAVPIREAMQVEIPKELAALMAEYAAPSSAEWDGWTFVLFCEGLQPSSAAYSDSLYADYQPYEMSLAETKIICSYTELRGLLHVTGSLLTDPGCMRSSAWPPFIKAFLRLYLRIISVEKGSAQLFWNSVTQACQRLFYAVRRTAAYLGQEAELLKEAAQLLQQFTAGEQPLQGQVKKQAWALHDGIKDAFLWHHSRVSFPPIDKAFFFQRWNRWAAFFYQQCGLSVLQKLFFSSKQELEGLFDLAPNADEIEHLTNNPLAFEALGRLWKEKDPQQSRELCNYLLERRSKRESVRALNALALWPLNETDINQLGQSSADYKAESLLSGSLKQFLAQQPEISENFCSFNRESRLFIRIAYTLPSLSAAERVWLAVWSLKNPKHELIYAFLEKDWRRIWREPAADTPSRTLFTQFWQEAFSLAQESSEVVCRLLEILIPHFNAAELNLFLKLRHPEKAQGLFADLLNPFRLRQLIQAICIALEEKSIEPLFLAEQLNLLREYDGGGEMAAHNREWCARLLIEHLVAWEFDQPANRTAIIAFLAHCCFAKTTDPREKAQQLFDNILQNL